MQEIQTYIEIVYHFRGTDMKLKSILLASAFALIAPTFAMAQEVSTSATLGAATDYIFRGVSQTNNKPELFGSLDASTDKFYVGTSFENIDFGTKANFEADLYAGFKPVMGPVTFDLGFLYYMYPQETSFNTLEYMGKATYGLPLDMTLSGAVYYSPEVGKGGSDSLYKELTFSAPLGHAKEGRPFGLSVGASYGSMASTTATDYNNWKVSLAATTEKGLVFEVGYSDSDFANAHLGDARGYALIKKTF